MGWKHQPDLVHLLLIWGIWQAAIVRIIVHNGGWIFSDWMSEKVV